MLKLNLKKTFAPDLDEAQRAHIEEWLNEQAARLDAIGDYPSIQFFYYLDYLGKTDVLNEKQISAVRRKAGQKFRERRKGLNVTQMELAHHIGVDNSVIAHLERGAGTIANYGAYVIALEFYQLVKGKSEVISEYQRLQSEKVLRQKEAATV